MGRLIKYDKNNEHLKEMLQKLTLQNLVMNQKLI